MKAMTTKCDNTINNAGNAVVLKERENITEKLLTAFDRHHGDQSSALSEWRGYAANWEGDQIKYLMPFILVNSYYRQLLLWRIGRM